MSVQKYIPDKVMFRALYDPATGYSYSGTAGYEISFRMYDQNSATLGARFGPQFPGFTGIYWYPLSTLEDANHYIPYDTFIAAIFQGTVKYFQTATTSGAVLSVDWLPVKPIDFYYVIVNVLSTNLTQYATTSGIQFDSSVSPSHTSDKFNIIFNVTITTKLNPLYQENDIEQIVEQTIVDDIVDIIDKQDKFESKQRRILNQRDDDMVETIENISFAFPESYYQDQQSGTAKSIMDSANNVYQIDTSSSNANNYYEPYIVGGAKSIMDSKYAEADLVRTVDNAKSYGKTAKQIMDEQTIKNKKLNVNTNKEIFKKNPSMKQFQENMNYKDIDSRLKHSLRYQADVQSIQDKFKDVKFFPDQTQRDNFISQNPSYVKSNTVNGVLEKIAAPNSQLLGEFSDIVTFMSSNIGSQDLIMNVLDDRVANDLLQNKNSADTPFFKSLFQGRDFSSYMQNLPSATTLLPVTVALISMMESQYISPETTDGLVKSSPFIDQVKNIGYAFTLNMGLDLAKSYMTGQPQPQAQQEATITQLQNEVMFDILRAHIAPKDYFDHQIRDLTEDYLYRTKLYDARIVLSNPEQRKLNKMIEFQDNKQKLQNLAHSIAHQRDEVQHRESRLGLYRYTPDRGSALHETMFSVHSSQPQYSLQKIDSIYESQPFSTPTNFTYSQNANNNIQYDQDLQDVLGNVYMYNALQSSKAVFDTAYKLGRFSDKMITKAINTKGQEIIEQFIPSIKTGVTTTYGVAKDAIQSDAAKQFVDVLTSDKVMYGALGRPSTENIPSTAKYLYDLSKNIDPYAASNYAYDVAQLAGNGVYSALKFLDSDQFKYGLVGKQSQTETQSSVAKYVYDLAKYMGTGIYKYAQQQDAIVQPGEDIVYNDVQLSNKQIKSLSDALRYENKVNELPVETKREAKQIQKAEKKLNNMLLKSFTYQQTLNPDIDLVNYSKLPSNVRVTQYDGYQYDASNWYPGFVQVDDNIFQVDLDEFQQDQQSEFNPSIVISTSNIKPQYENEVEYYVDDDIDDEIQEQPVQLPVIGFRQKAIRKHKRPKNDGIQRRPNNQRNDNVPRRPRRQPQDRPRRIRLIKKRKRTRRGIGPQPQNNPQPVPQPVPQNPNLVPGVRPIPRLRAPPRIPVLPPLTPLRPRLRQPLRPRRPGVPTITETEESSDDDEEEPPETQPGCGWKRRKINGKWKDIYICKPEIKKKTNKRK